MNTQSKVSCKQNCPGGARPKSRQFTLGLLQPPCLVGKFVRLGEARIVVRTSLDGWLENIDKVGGRGSEIWRRLCLREYLLIDTALKRLRKGAELGKVTALLSRSISQFSQGCIPLNDKFLFSALREDYKNGYITKEEYALTLRENQKASNEMKSESREMIKKVMAEA